ncbi:MAG: acyl-homoserine-lactone synthase [Patescibacteria group bacterium]
MQKYIFGNNKEISIGIPTKPNEKVAMFDLRHKEYLRRHYTDPNFKGGGDIDEIDETPDCTYFIAIYNDTVIGTARLIRQSPLPTQRAFKFEEPEEIKVIKPWKRAEASRVIVSTVRIKELKIAQHLVMFGLFGAMTIYGENSDLQGGYAFIKTSLWRIFQKLSFPVRIISDFKIADYPKIMRGYFEDDLDHPIPIYYLYHEIKANLMPILSSFLKKNGQSIKTEEPISKLLVG